jgi:hypothetical protein
MEPSNIDADKIDKAVLITKRIVMFTRGAEQEIV